MLIYILDFILSLLSLIKKEAKKLFYNPISYAVSDVFPSPEVILTLDFRLMDGRTPSAIEDGEV